MRLNIAILTGGNDAEKVVSYKSAAVVQRHLPAEKFQTFQIDIQGKRWRELTTGQNINKNDFSLRHEGKKIKFDCAFAALHGSPLEDGRLQGYFETLSIPYTCCTGFVSALTMNKHLTKTLLAPHGIPMAKSIFLKKGQKIDQKRLLEMGLPLFVKPNQQGSSFGVTKVKTADELLPAIKTAFKFDSEILVEGFMPGREFSNGAMRRGKEIIVFPITEIIPETEFFDFAAKYEGKSREVTPAEISPEQTAQCQSRTRLLYEILGCSGACRMDFILVGDTFFFLEANTIPGLTEASLLPQQARAFGWTTGQLFEEMIFEAMRKQPARARHPRKSGSVHL